jgi:hypothetical protein
VLPGAKQFLPMTSMRMVTVTEPIALVLLHRVLTVLLRLQMSSQSRSLARTVAEVCLTSLLV